MSNFMEWSFSAGRLFGIPIRVHWTLLALSAIWVLKETTPKAMGWKLAVCGVLTVTVLVHELGHAFAARGVGGEAHSIVLWPLGGLAYTSHGTHTPHGSHTSREGRLVDDIKIVLGGPLTHIPLAILFARLLIFQGVPWDWAYLHPLSYWETPVSGFWVYLSLYALKIQVGLFLFNLLVPVYPLDGGCLLVDLMLFRFSRETAAKVILVSSVICGVALIPVGHLFLVIWVFYEAYNMGNHIKKRELDRHPLFARVPDIGAAPPARKPSGGGVVLQFRRREESLTPPTAEQRACPYCKRSLPREAKMCGPCEKMLPPL